MITNKKYITRLFPFALLVGSVSIFAMEQDEMKQEIAEVVRKYGEYAKIFSKYSKDFLVVDEYGRNNEGCLRETMESDEYDTSRSALIEAMEHIYEKPELAPHIIKALGVNPDIYVPKLLVGFGECNLFVHTVNSLMRRANETGKFQMGVVEELLKLRADPDKGPKQFKKKFKNASYLDNLVKYVKAFSGYSNDSDEQPKIVVDWTAQGIVNWFANDDKWGTNLTNKEEIIDQINCLFADARNRNKKKIILD